MTPPALEVPNASDRGTKPKTTDKWARAWLQKPCHLGGPQRFTVRDKFRSGPHCGLGSYRTLATLLVSKAVTEGERITIGP